MGIILGLSSLQNTTATFRMLPYRVPTDATNNKCRIVESIANVQQLPAFMIKPVEYVQSPRM